MFITFLIEKIIWDNVVSILDTFSPQIWNSAFCDLQWFQFQSFTFQIISDFDIENYKSFNETSLCIDSSSQLILGTVLIWMSHGQRRFWVLGKDFDDPNRVQKRD